MTAYVKMLVYAYSMRGYIHLITTTDVVLLATANLFTTGRRFQIARYLLSKLIKILPFLEMFLVLRV